MNDKRFGYVILLFLFAAFLSILGYVLWVLAFPKETRIISFDRISNLRVDDPMKVKGVTVATITDISGKGERVPVTVKFDEPFTIYKGYTIYSSDKGILGDRIIILQNGDSNNPVIPKKDTLIGTFNLGVSEALGRAWRLKDLIVSFKEDASIFLSGSQEKPSFVSTFASIISEIDSFSLRLHSAAAFLNSEVGVKVDTLQRILAEAKNISDQIEGIVPGKIKALDNQLDTIITYVDKLNPIIHSLTDIVEKIKDNKLIQDNDISRLVAQLKDLQKLISIIQEGTARLKLRIKLGFNEKIPE